MPNVFVYILKCSDGSYYIGHTSDLEQRIAEHNAGIYAGYTSTRLPIVLVFAQEFQSRNEAFLLERRLKGWSRKKKEAFIRGDMEELKVLSKNRLN